MSRSDEGDHPDLGGNSKGPSQDPIDELLKRNGHPPKRNLGRRYYDEHDFPELSKKTLALIVAIVNVIALSVDSILVDRCF